MGVAVRGTPIDYVYVYITVRYNWFKHIFFSNTLKMD